MNPSPSLQPLFVNSICVLFRHPVLPPFLSQHFLNRAYLCTYRPEAVISLSFNIYLLQLFHFPFTSSLKLVTFSPQGHRRRLPFCSVQPLFWPSCLLIPTGVYPDPHTELRFIMSDWQHGGRVGTTGLPIYTPSAGSPSACMTNSSVVCSRQAQVCVCVRVCVRAFACVCVCRTCQTTIICYSSDYIYTQGVFR